MKSSQEFNNVRADGLIGTWNFETDGNLAGGKKFSCLNITLTPSISPSVFEISTSDTTGDVGAVELCI